jgi:hypothetical protein
MNKFINDILSQTHSEIKIDAAASAQLGEILKSIADVISKQWINNTLQGQVAAHAKNYYKSADCSNLTQLVFPDLPLPEASAIQYITAEILDVAGNHISEDKIVEVSDSDDCTIKDIITLDDLLTSIYNDQELYNSLKDYIPKRMK